jgi:hypothetical protein
MPDTVITIDCDKGLPVLREAARRLRGGSVTLTADRMESARALVETVRDEHRDILVRAIESGFNIRGKHGRGAAALKLMAAELKGLPAYLRVKAFEDLVVLDVHTMVERMVDELEEFRDLAGYPFRLTWRTKAGTSGGRIQLGTCRATSERERLTYDGPGPAPFWEITLALDAWLLAHEVERWRLVHHEMAHADLDFGDDEDGNATPKPAIKHHDVEDFTSTMGRFGPEFAAELAFMDAAAAHPSIGEKRKQWSGTGAQVALFPAWDPL